MSPGSSRSRCQDRVPYIRIYQGKCLRDKWWAWGSQGRLGKHQTLNKGDRGGRKVEWRDPSPPCSLRKVQQGSWGALKPKLAIRGVPCLSGVSPDFVSLSCSIAGWEQPEEVWPLSKGSGWALGQLCFLYVHSYGQHGDV